MKVENQGVSEDVQAKVEAYVYANYPSLKGKTLIIKENESSFLVYKHADGGPMFLGKGILG